MNLIKQRGVGIIEVLVAFVIVATSAAALVGLQTNYMKTEDDSTARETAMHLAESTLDDLRMFDCRETSASCTDSYQAIASNTTGQSVTIGKFTYNVHWVVTPTLPLPARKDVQLTVSWSNNQGNNSSIIVYGHISPIVSISSGEGLSSGFSGSSMKPKVAYDPGAAPDVISVTVDTAGTKQETTKPLPEVANSGGSIASTFSTITYDSDSNTQVQSDFNTISCSCNFAANVSAYLPAYPYLTNTDMLYWKVGNSVNKRSGTVANNQPTLCSVCCANHFNNAADSGEENKDFTDYFNQLNRSAPKFRYTGSSLSEVSSGSYIDSCRLLRIDGYYRPMPDWNLVKLNIMSSSYLSNSDNLEKYQEYIHDVVVAYIESMQASGLWGTSSDNRAKLGISTGNVDNSDIPSFSDWLSSNDGNPTALTMTLGDTPTQLIARGIFIDLLNNAYTNNDESSVDVKKLDLNDPELLKKVPFYDINMTLLSRWESASAAVSVANEVIKTLDASDTDYYGVYRRGYITPVTATASGGVNVTATAYQGNSSVAAYQYSKNSTEIAVSEFERDYARSGSINVTVNSSAANDGKVSVIGKIYCYGAKNNGDIASCKQGQTNYLSNITLSSTAATCQLETVANETSYLLYNCKVTPPATSSSVTVSTTASGFSVSPTGALSFSTYLNGVTSPVTGGCFNVYSNSINLVKYPLPTTCP